MKKIFVALVLALALCLSFVGCGEKSGADYVIESFENLDEQLEAVQITENTHVSLSVADINSLCTLLGVDADSIPTLKDAFIEMYANAGYAMANFGVTMGDKPLNLSISSDTEKMVLSSEQLSADYGCTVEELYKLLGTLTGGNYEGLQKYIDPAVAEAMDARYGEKIEALVRENFEFTTAKDGKNVLVSFALTPENVSTVAYELVAYVQADTELLEMIGAMYGEEIVTEIGALEPNRDEMLSELTESGFAGDVTLTIRKKDSKLMAADVTITADETPVTLQYAENATGFTANVKAEDVTVDIAGKSGDDTYAFTVKATESGETVDFTLQVAQDITLSVTADGMTVTATADYTETKNGFEATLTEVKVAGIGLDLTDIGIKLAVETGVEMPAMPEAYTSIANYTEQEFQALMLEFIMNSGLLAYMQ